MVARQPEISVRTGDTPQKERNRFRRHPAEILITTPESLYLLLTSESAISLRTVDTVIVDEIHALVPTKRGVHLALSLERLEAITEKRIQRIGLSATQRPLEEVAHFLAGCEPRQTVKRDKAESIAAIENEWTSDAEPEGHDRQPVFRPVTIINASEPKSGAWNRSPSRGYGAPRTAGRNIERRGLRRRNARRYGARFTRGCLRLSANVNRH